MRHKTTHSQFELFPGVVGNSEQKNNTRVFLKSITISVENLVVLIVVIVISMVTAFSIGVERGKRKIAAQAHRRVPLQETAVPLVEQEDSVKEPIPVAEPVVPLKTEVTAPVIQASLEVVPLTEPQKSEVEKIQEKQYTVQVASFKKEKYAQEEAEGLKQSGYEIFVLPKGKYSIVCVGKFAQKDQAKEISNRLRKKYKDCLIRRL